MAAGLRVFRQLLRTTRADFALRALAVGYHNNWSPFAQDSRLNDTDGRVLRELRSMNAGMSMLRLPESGKICFLPSLDIV